eukprot:2490508-Amphidinium_carterae.1
MQAKESEAPSTACALQGSTLSVYPSKSVLATSLKSIFPELILHGGRDSQQQQILARRSCKPQAASQSHRKETKKCAHSPHEELLRSTVVHPKTKAPSCFRASFSTVSPEQGCPAIGSL